MAISYIAYCCYKIVEFKVNQELNEKISHRAIKELLDEIETIIYEDQNTREQFMMPTPASEKAQAIYKIFNQELICRPCRYTA
jgi:hypothetical protein